MPLHYRSRRSPAISQSYIDFVRRYREQFPAADNNEAARTRREFGWQPLIVSGDPAVATLQKQQPELPQPGAQVASVEPVMSVRARTAQRDDNHEDPVPLANPRPAPVPPPPLPPPRPWIPVLDDTDSGSASSGDSDTDDLPDAQPNTEGETDMEEEVVRAPSSPPSKKKSVTEQRVDETWVKRGLLDIVNRGKLRGRLRSDVQNKVTQESIAGALRPVFSTNFTAKFTTETCQSLHQFRAKLEKALDKACWFCQERHPLVVGRPAARVEKVGEPEDRFARDTNADNMWYGAAPGTGSVNLFDPSNDGASSENRNERAWHGETDDTGGWGGKSDSTGFNQGDAQENLEDRNERDGPGRRNGMMEDEPSDRGADDDGDAYQTSVTVEPNMKCMQICQISQLDVICRRRSDERFISIIGLADPVEGRRFRHACNDTCMEEWELLLQYGAAARLRSTLGSSAAAIVTDSGLSRPVSHSVRVSPTTRCSDKFELRYRLCYPAGTWAQRVIIDLEHTNLAIIIAAVIGILLLFLLISAFCYYRVFQIPRVAAAINGWLRRMRLKWRVADGLERTESGHYRRASMVRTGAHGKQSREEIRRTVNKWRKQRQAEGRTDGAPKSIYSAARMLHPPPAGTTFPTDDQVVHVEETYTASDQIETERSG